jgi:DNA-binding transcriptional LysR family regulator
LIDATPHVIPHLTSLRIDAATHDPIDAIASPNARRLMDIARERFDVVIVAGPAISDPLSDTVARRIDFAVLVGTAGKTTMPQLATATAILTERKTDSPGVVILSGRRKALVPTLSDRFNGTRSTVATTVTRWRAPDDDEHTPDPVAQPPQQSTTGASGVEDLVEQTTNAGSKAGPSTR